jgi:hypothetical protein
MGENDLSKKFALANISMETGQHYSAAEEKINKCGEVGYRVANKSVHRSLSKT